MPSEAPTLSWPLPRDTLSPSSIALYIRCPEAFRRKYILGERDPTAVSGLLGTAVHGAQEINLRQKIVTGRDLSVGEIEDAYLDAYDREIDASGGVSEIDWRFDDRRLLPSKAKDIARNVNRLYHERIAPTIDPLAAEHWVEIRIPGVVPRIVGKIDVLKRGAGKIDLKFGGSAAKNPRPDWLLQAGIYNLADDTPFEWHTASWGSERYGPAVHTPATAPGLLLRSSPDDKRVMEGLVRTYMRAMVAAYRQFGPYEPWPGDGRFHQWACDFCTFGPKTNKIGGRGTCDWWPRAVEEAPVRELAVSPANGNLL